ncbi:HTH-type transcriptional repressor YtrA [compost metagenome]
MKVFINRESPIPLHDQLVTQISLLIASGVLAPGQRLPSVRDLANRLSVHRNTVMAVYNTLEAHGVVTIKAGSGVRVLDATHPAPQDGWREGVALRHLASRFISEARDHGYADEAIREAFELAMAPRPMRRIVVVDPHPDFHPLYREELSAVFNLPIELMTLDDVRRVGGEALDDAAILTSMYHVTPLREMVGAERRVVVFSVNAGDPILARIRALPAGASLGLVTVSETLLRMAKEIIAGLRGEEVLILEAGPDDPDRLKSVWRLSDLIIADTAAFTRLGRLGAKPIERFQLLPEASIRSLAQQLPPEAFRAALVAPASVS